MSMHLFVTTGADKDRAFPLAETDMVTIGSSHKNAEICLHDIKVARTHCELQVDGKRVTVADLDSESGTFVNGTRITAPQELKAGDVIGLGETQLCLRDGDMDRRKPAKADLSSGGYAVSSTPAEQLQALTGTSLAHYTVQALLGKGYAGVVYRARDLKTNHTVAFKVLQPSFPKGDAERHRFIGAMKTMLPLRHPNLVTLLATGKAASYIWLALDYVEGDSAAAMIERSAGGRLLDWKIAYRVAVHVARALDYAHQNGVVHGNVTPRNILFRAADKTVLLNDLILMRALEGSELKQSTWQQKMAAELPYLAPEQTQAPASAGPRTDLYCLGAVVYALLTGRPPCVAKTAQDMIKRIRGQEPASPKEAQQSMPDPFEKAVLKMLAKRPEDRIPTAADAVNDLERVGRNLGMRV
jgi:serine/threonine protein kinase